MAEKRAKKKDPGKNQVRDSSHQHLSSEVSPSSDDIRQLALAMTELSASMHELVTYLEENPEIKSIPESLRELTKRISVLSTRL